MLKLQMNINKIVLIIYWLNKKNDLVFLTFNIILLHKFSLLIINSQINIDLIDLINKLEMNKLLRITDLERIFVLYIFLSELIYLNILRNLTLIIIYLNGKLGSINKIKNI